MSGVHILVVRVVGDQIVSLAPEVWEGFCRGNLPLPAEGTATDRLNVLMLTLRDDTCELVEPVSLDVDEHGFLKRMHVAFEPLPSSRVLDARSAFLGRYLRHTHRWRPSFRLIERALRHANVAPVG